jgi:serine/threonine-protein kinase
MAPEQLEGKEADARTDLWALGAILYEMLTGLRAFEGESQVSLIGNIMNAEPPALATTQPLTPPSLDRVVTKCLAKHPDDRWDGAHDVADELRWLRESPGQATHSQAPSRYRRLHVAVAMAVVGFAGALVAVGVLWLLGSVRADSAHVVRTSLPVRPADEVTGGSDGSWIPTPGGSRASFAWTPDGRMLVFIGWRVASAAAPASPYRAQVYVRELERPEARALPGTEDARGPVAISPDGLSVAFWRARAIRRVPLGGGPVTVLAEPVPQVPARIAWGRSGLLVFDGSPDGALWQCTGEGPPTPLTALRKGEIVHGLPHLIDRDRVLMYTVRRDRTVWGEEEVVAQVLSTGERTRVVAQAADAQLLSTGHLAFMRRGGLWAVTFDSGRHVAVGEAVPVEESVAQALAGDNDRGQSGVGQFDVSGTGTLAYIPGALPSYPEQALVRIDRAGRTTELTAPRGPYLAYVRRAGTGPLLYADQITLTEHGVWRHDRSHPGSLTKVLLGLDDSFAVRPDGRGVVYGTVRDGMQVVAWQHAEGEPPETLAQGSFRPVSWTPDGRYLFLVSRESRIWVYTVESTEPRLRPLSEGTDREQAPEISPDGRWLAFMSDETGRFEVYVRPFPGPGTKTQVTVEGGVSPAWNPKGNELFFVTSKQTSKSCTTGPLCMSAAAVDLDHGPRVGTARRLFDFDNVELGLYCSPARCYEVAEDGAGFFAVKSVHGPGPRPIVTHINLIQNWFEVLKAKVPATR